MHRNRKNNKLSLNRETLRSLDEMSLAGVNGGIALPTWLPTSETNGIPCLSKVPRLCGDSKACPKETV